MLNLRIHCSTKGQWQKEENWAPLNAILDVMNAPLRHAQYGLLRMTIWLLSRCYPYKHTAVRKYALFDAALKSPCTSEERSTRILCWLLCIADGRSNRRLETGSMSLLLVVRTRFWCVQANPKERGHPPSPSPLRISLFMLGPRYLDRPIPNSKSGIRDKREPLSGL